MILTCLLILFAACSEDDLAGDTNSNEQDAVVEEMESGETGEEETEEVAESEPKLEIVQSTGAAWKNSIDTIWVHSGAIFENTGKVPVEIGETQMNFKGTDGSILGTSSMNYAVPSIVAPGEQAYISESTILDTITDTEEYAETTYNFNFAETDENPNLLEVSGVKGIPGTDGFSSPYKVTGIVTNTTQELQDDIRISAALLDEDGTLLGILNGAVDVGVNPGSEAGFELGYPDIPLDVVDKVATVEVKAYGWTW